jgi:hypothetical protein
MDAKHAIEQLIKDIEKLRGTSAFAHEMAPEYLSKNADTIVKFLDETYLRHSEAERQVIFDSKVDHTLDYSGIPAEFLSQAKSFTTDLDAMSSKLEEDVLNMTLRGLRYARHFQHPEHDYKLYLSPV